MITLTHDEVAALTGKVKKSAQCLELAKLGIPYKSRSDGTPVVLRVSLEVAFGHAPTNQGSSSPRLRLPEARSVLVREGRAVAAPRR